MKRFHRPSIFQNLPQLIAAQSTRHGGVSPAPYQSLNLGKNTADAAENVSENKRRFCADLGFAPEQLAWSTQVHGAEIRLVEAPSGATGFDALITQTPGVVLGVSVADCTPVLVYDTKNRAVAAIHAGWRGAAAGIVEKTLAAMAQHFGTEGAHCLAYVGTCIDDCSFEVGDAVAAEFAEAYKRFDPGRGKYFVDLKRVCAGQLLDFGLSAGQLELSPFSTVLDNADYFSHRKEGGVTGRGLAVIGVQGKTKDAAHA
jgi:YfiH family protein